jgi:ABC-type branched-subunit amino acid transport system permease subunit
MLKRLVLILGAEALLLLVLAGIPLTVNNSFVLGLLTLLMIYGILLIGLDITVGYLGQVNLAQAAFLGLGAYTAALAVTRFGCGMTTALIAATAVGCLFGGILSPAVHRVCRCPALPCSVQFWRQRDSTGSAFSCLSLSG